MWVCDDAEQWGITIDKLEWSSERFQKEYPEFMRKILKNGYCGNAIIYYEAKQ